MESTLRILLADDVAANRRAMKRLLSRRGCEITVASNGQEALDQLAMHHFDVVLLDLQMPVLDGMGTVKAIRDSELPSNQSLPVVAMSARGTDSDRRECIEAGFDACVPKPVDLDELLQVIGEFRGLATEPEKPPISRHALASGSRADEPCANASRLIENGGDLPVLDREETLQRVQGDESMFNLFAKQFETQADSTLADLQAAESCSDIEQVVQEAHRLRGIAGNLGAKQVEQLTANIERAVSSGDTTTVSENIQRLPDAIGLVNRELKAKTASRRTN